MKKENAVKIIVDKFPNHDIVKVTETKKYFLVGILPKMKKTASIIRPIPCNDGLMAVDKATGGVFTYNPIRHGK
jgi:hypothetical protein